MGAIFECGEGFGVGAAPGVVVLGGLLGIGRNDPDGQGARRRAFTFFGLALAGATPVTMTLFVSPKVGSHSRPASFVSQMRP